MGMSINGGMIVGNIASSIDYDEDEFECLSDFAEEHNMSSLSPYYDSDYDDRWIGFCVDDVLIDDMDSWVYEVKLLGEKFEQLTGTKAFLIGAQDVY